MIQSKFERVPNQRARADWASPKPGLWAKSAANDFRNSISVRYEANMTQFTKSGRLKEPPMPSSFDPKMSEEHVDEWLGSVREFLRILATRKKQQFNRRVSVGDLLTDRIDNAVAYGFGEGTTMYEVCSCGVTSWSAGIPGSGRAVSWTDPGAICRSATGVRFPPARRSIHITP
jgi:hypothetical protein